MRLVLLFISIYILSACQSYSDNELVTDLQSASACTSCINAAASPAELTMSSAGGVNLFVPALYPVLHIGGDCFASQYPNNKINYSLFQGNNVVNAGFAIVAVNKEAQMKCKNGRFDMIMATSSLPTGVYKLRLSLIGIDPKGVEWNNAASYLEFNISRL